MQINRLRLRNFRGFKDAEFHFQPGMNLIVGINGAGKSTVLDALSIAFSKILPKFTVSVAGDHRLSFKANDVMSGYETLEVDVDFQASEIPFECNIRGGKNYKLKIKPDSQQILDTIKNAENQPIVVYFATRRSIVTEGADKNKDRRASGDPSAAFPDALKPRMLRLAEFTDWYLAQNALSSYENHLPAKRRIEALNNAVTIFLDQFTNLRVDGSDLVVDKDGVTLNINQLSDGERGLLALILDLVKRLLQANPGLEDPLKDGKAVVLIDELDLHLHPRWQRMVVKKLTDIFPSCQFIATTHSPQIIGEVDPESIIILEKDQQPYRPNQSLGMDSNWILRFLMETSERDLKTQQRLEHIESLIQDRKFSEANEEINSLRELGEFPELVRLQTRIDRISRLGK
jgi:predicted ATP-binding protein involved in virulence